MQYFLRTQLGYDLTIHNIPLWLTLSFTPHQVNRTFYPIAQRPVPHQQAPLAVPVILIFSREYPATILAVPLTDHGTATSSARIRQDCDKFSIAFLQ